MRIRSVVCLFLLLALVATGCGRAEEPGGDEDQAGEDAVEPTESESVESEAQGVLQVGSAGQPPTLDPQAADPRAALVVTHSIFEGLVEFDPEGELEPLLATALPEQSPDDPTRWTIQLREGIEFTNGEPLNSEAVVANLERILDPDFGSPFVAELGTVTGAEAIDEYTVAFTTTGNDPVFPNRLRSLRLVPPVASLEEGFSENPVGTGPYVFDSWEHGQELTLTANPSYWGEPKPSIETVIVRFIPDDNTRISALQTGEIDIALDIPFSQLGRVPQVLESPGSAVSIMAFPVEIEPYTDPNLRLAMLHAINVQEIIDTIFDGHYQLAHCQPVVPTAGGHNPNLQPLPYDPDLARELLASVDLPPGFSVGFEAPSNIFTSDRELVEAIMGYWQAVGLQTDVSLNESEAHLEAAYDKERPAVFYSQTDQQLNHGSRQVGILLARDGPVTRRVESYSELDELIETAFETTDDDERQEAYNEIWRIACEDALVGSFFVTSSVAAASERVNYVPGFNEVYRMEYNRVTLTD